MNVSFLTGALPLAGVLWAFNISDPVGKIIVVVLIFASVFG